ncbi:MAG: VOC family protein [Acidobacteria bacterium]|nr:VOC family protein [Acidobacteriota bacterium]
MKTHISINVRDVSRSIDFYSRMFGADPVKIRDDYAKFDISNPPLNFTMNRRAFEQGGTLSHLGLQVDSTAEVVEIGTRWRESGLITLDEMETDCCYALQDKTWIQDPDGNRWEVFTVLADTNPIATCAASACCAPVGEAVSIGQNCAECRVQSAECRVQSAECRVQSAECKVQSAKFKGQRSKIKGQSSKI